MTAATKAFTQYSKLAKYIDVCSSLIMNKPGTEIPLCMIRNDFNHVMHLISSWPEIKSSPFRVKNFYLRSIGLIIVSTSYIDIKQLLKMIFTVALCETEGNFNNEQTLCEIAKIYLKNRIATHTNEFDLIITDIDCKKDHINLQEECVTINEIGHTIFNEIKYIYDLCVKNANDEAHCTGDRDNMQFCPAILKRLLDFCKLIPCWSALMVPIFKYGNLTETSCTSESLFKDLKTIVFKHKPLPLRLDDFLKIHINSILGSMNILADKTGYNDQQIKNEQTSSDEETDIMKTPTESNKSDENQDPSVFKIYEEKNEIKSKKNYRETISPNVICPSPEKKNSTETFYDDPLVLENWKGLRYQVGKKKRKETYLDKDPSILYTNDTNCSNNKVIGLLKNGNISDLKSIQIYDKFYCITNTCAFDSTVQIMCSSYVDSHIYAEWLNTNSSNNMLFKLVVNAIRDGITSQTYKKRVYILKPIILEYKTLNETPNGLIILDSACTANFMYQKLFEKYPSYEEEKICLFCSHNQTRSFITITVNLPTKSINFLQDVLKSTFEADKKCIQCDSSIRPKYKFGNYILIEPIMIETIKVGQNKTHFDLPVVLKDIPTKINLFDKQFTLRGLINFIQVSYRSLCIIQLESYKQ